MEDEDNFNDETTGLIEDHGLDYEEAKEVQDIMDTEGLDAEDAMEVKGLTEGSGGGGISWVGIIFVIILISPFKIPRLCRGM